MALWRTERAAKKLKVTTATIRSLIDRGVLHDKATNGEGKKKHYAKVESREVIELAKVYRKRAHSHPMPAPHESTPKPLRQHESPASGILTRLSSIESKLDQLIAMWR